MHQLFFLLSLNFHPSSKWCDIECTSFTVLKTGNASTTTQLRRRS